MLLQYPGQLYLQLQHFLIVQSQPLPQLIVLFSQTIVNVLSQHVIIIRYHWTVQLQIRRRWVEQTGWFCHVYYAVIQILKPNTHFLSIYLICQFILHLLGATQAHRKGLKQNISFIKNLRNMLCVCINSHCRHKHFVPDWILAQVNHQLILLWGELTRFLDKGKFLVESLMNFRQ